MDHRSGRDTTHRAVDAAAAVIGGIAGYCGALGSRAARSGHVEAYATWDELVGDGRLVASC